MQLKVDDKGIAALQDGKPVYLDTDGKEVAVDVPGLFGKVNTLNNESATRRRDYNDLKTKLDVFNGIEDLPAWAGKAKEALETVQNLSDKKLVDANQVDALKKNLSEGFTKQLSEKEKTIAGKDALIHKLAISSKFAASPLFSGDNAKTILLPDIAESYFGKHFKVEVTDSGPQVVGMIDGNPIYSREKPGETAPFDEAMDAILNAYPLKDRILRAGGGGSGSSGHSGGGSGGDSAEIAQLRKDREAALTAGDITKALALKNRIFELEQQQKK